MAGISQGQGYTTESYYTRGNFGRVFLFYEATRDFYT